MCGGKQNTQTQTNLPHTEFIFNLNKKGNILLIGTMNFDMKDALTFLNFEEME
jgi:hypothetical protein